MELHATLLLTSLVLIGLLPHTPQSMTHGNCQRSGQCKYIVRVRPPPNISMVDLSSMNLESWYRSFLPPHMERLRQLVSPFIHTYKEAILGFAIDLTDDEVEYVKSKDGVLMVYKDRLLPLLTTHTPDFLNLRPNGGAWNSLGNMGEGSIIGVLDTGIHSAHSSFDDEGMSTPPSKWRGSCHLDSGHHCNKKLIGAKSFICGPNNCEVPLDDVGHGTHTASIAAGNFVQGASVLGSGNGTAAGMAPRAHLAIYKVCTDRGCDGSDILAGLEAAITDGVDILSISLATSYYPQPFPEDIIAIGTFSAMKKGIFVSCSAENSGPLPSTLSNEGPWVLTVGASTMDRRMEAIVKLGDGRSFIGESAYQPSASLPVPLPLMFQSDTGNIMGKVVVVEHHGSQVRIGQSIKDGGGVGMIILGPGDGGQTTMAAAHVLPASFLNSQDGAIVRQYIATSNKPTASFIFNGTSLGTTLASVVAYFSSRGPSTASPGILKPDVIGPGVNVIAAWPFKVGPNTTAAGREQDDTTFNSMSGTSMSAPHLSGIAAIIKSAHPDWSPAMIKSAIMTTAYVVYANNQPILDEQLNPASHFSIGAGHVNPSQAINPGLVYDIDVEQYIMYICGLGYTDSQVETVTHEKDACNNGRKIAEAELNYPSIATRASVGKLVVNRTVTNVGDAVSSYSIEIDMPKEVEATMSPTKLEFTKLKENKTFTVILSWDASKTKYAQGSFKWVSSKHVVRSPIVIF